MTFVAAILTCLSVAQTDDPGGLRPLLERYETDRKTLERFYSLPVDPAGAKRKDRFLAGWERKLRDVEFKALGREGRIDFVLFRNHLRHERRALAHGAKRQAEVLPLVPFWKTVSELGVDRRRMKPMNGRAAAERLSDLAREARKARESLKAEGPLLHRAARLIDALRKTIEEWDTFHRGYHPEYTWWAKKPYADAEGELKKLAGALRKRGGDALAGTPIGREALLDELAVEMIPYSPEELLSIAGREFAWCETEMKRAAEDLKFDGDWSRALVHVKSLHVKPGKQPDLVRKLAKEAVDFLDKRKLVTIPDLCRETWQMRMMSPEKQKVTPFFTGGEVVTVAYPTDTMTHSEKLMSLRSNNLHFSRAVVHHELIPGHHLQLFMAKRHRTHRQPFRTPFLVEGWALYWEMLLWDLGFPKSPEDRVGMLFWRSHRCARIIVTLKFHLEMMKPREMVDFLVTRIGHESSAAEAEVRRYLGGDYGPLYQCAYMLGGLQIRALRKERVESGKMKDLEFHDAILRQNAIPIEMIRAALTEQKLDAGFTSRWRFAD